MSVDPLFYRAADDMLTDLGDRATPVSVNLLVAWSQREWDASGDLERTNNPLATEYPKDAAGISTVDIGYGPGNWNPQGVLIFDTLADGAAACVSNLTGGRYPTLIAALAASDSGLFFSGAGLAELTTWGGSSGYAQVVLDLFDQLGTPPSWALTPTGGGGGGGGSPPPSYPLQLPPPGPAPWAAWTAGLALAAGAVALGLLLWHVPQRYTGRGGRWLRHTGSSRR